MMEDNNYRIYLVKLPASIHGAVRIDNDGFASIYINDALSPQAKRAAAMHEIRHIRRNDFTNARSIQEIERCPDKNANT